jgi:hypothetical protein
LQAVNSEPAILICFISSPDLTSNSQNSLPRGFDPPSVKATRSHQKTKQNVASLTVGLASMHPTLAATGSHGRTDAETLQLADEKAS